MPGVAYMQGGALYDLHGRLMRAPQTEQSGAASSSAAGIVESAQQSAPTGADIPQRSSAAERMHISRKRRRDGLRCVPFEIRDSEIEILVTRGLLDPVARNDRSAVARALGTLLDGVPLDRWPMTAPRS